MPKGLRNFGTPSSSRSVAVKPGYCKNGLIGDFINKVEEVSGGPTYIVGNNGKEKLMLTKIPTPDWDGTLGYNLNNIALPLVGNWEISFDADLEMTPNAYLSPQGGLAMGWNAGGEFYINDVMNDNFTITFTNISHMTGHIRIYREGTNLVVDNGTERESLPFTNIYHQWIISLGATNAASNGMVGKFCNLKIKSGGKTIRHFPFEEGDSSVDADRSICAITGTEFRAVNKAAALIFAVTRDFGPAYNFKNGYAKNAYGSQQFNNPNWSSWQDPLAPDGWDYPSNDDVDNYITDLGGMGMGWTHVNGSTLELPNWAYHNDHLANRKIVVTIVDWVGDGSIEYYNAGVLVDTISGAGTYEYELAPGAADSAKFAATATGDVSCRFQWYGVHHKYDIYAPTEGRIDKTAEPGWGDLELSFKAVDSAEFVAADSAHELFFSSGVPNELTNADVVDTADQYFNNGNEMLVYNMPITGKCLADTEASQAA